MTTWDKIYKKYLKGGPAYASLSFKIYPQFKKYIKQSKFTSKYALDIGCGDGRYLEYLQKLGFKTDGIDSSATSVKMTKKLLNDKSRILCANMFKYKIPSNKYDFIFSINTIHHGKKTEIKKLIQRISEALPPRGKIFITLPYYRQVNKWKSFKKNKLIQPGTYLPLAGPEKGLPHSFFTKKEACALFAKFHHLKIRLDKWGKWNIQAEK